MRIQRHCRWGMMLILATLFVTGCLTPNSRQIKIGLVTARARLVEGKATYYQLEIQRPLDELAPRILIQLPDGKVIDSTLYNYNALKQAGFIAPADGDYNPSNPYSHELSRHGVSFFFNQGSLMLIRMIALPGVEVRVAGERGRVFRGLPLSQEDLERLFGRPEKTSDRFVL